MAAMTTPQVSLGSWAFSFGPFESDPWSWERFVDYAAEVGYDGVEINAIPPHPHPDTYDTAAKCTQLMQQLADKGLGVSGYAVNVIQRVVEPLELRLCSYRVYLKTIVHFFSFCRMRTSHESPSNTSVK